MLKCPKCNAEIRYIAKAQAEPIAVNIKAECLITETGRTVKGFRQHFCKMEKEKSNGEG